MIPLSYSKSFHKWLSNRHRPLTVKQYLYILNLYKESKLTPLQYAQTIGDKKRLLVQFRALVMNFARYQRSLGNKDDYRNYTEIVDSIYVQKFKSEVTNENILTDQEYTAIRERMESRITEMSGEYHDKLPYMVIAFMLLAGLRINEVLTLTKNAIQTKETAKIIIINKDVGKGGKERLIPLSNALLSLYEAFLTVVPAEQEHLFVNTQGNLYTRHSIVYPIKAAEKEAGFSRYVHPHSFRHTFATMLLEHGATAAEVRDLLGHSNISTTSMYLHTDLIGLKKAVNKM